LADDLVAEDEGLVDEGEVAFEDVEVGAADSAGEDAEEDVAGGEGRRGDVSNFERLVGGLEDCGSHGTSLFAIEVEFFWNVSKNKNLKSRGTTTATAKSRSPSGMTTRKATARTNANANAGFFSTPLLATTQAASVEMTISG
jgi:hypothetical protein